MGGASGKLSTSAKEIDRPNGTDTDQTVEDVLAEIARKLWGKNTPAKLAAEIKCSERTVERYMEGSREWSGDALAAIISEILKRHAMRNVRIAARK